MGGGSNRNLRVADWAYRLIQEEGPKTVSEIKDYINRRRFTYGGTSRAYASRYRSVTHQQLTQVLRCSPLFKGAGMTKIRYNNWSRTPRGFSTRGIDADHKTGPPATMGTLLNEVQLYDIVPVSEIADKMEGKQHTTRTRWPKILKDELKQRGII